MKQIHNLEELDQLIQEHHQLLIFKNSTTCGISRMALKQFVSDLNSDDQPVAVAMVDVKADRPLSLGIAERYGIQHESPQVLALNNNKVTYHHSHHNIDYNQAKDSLQ